MNCKATRIQIKSANDATQIQQVLFKKSKIINSSSKLKFHQPWAHISYWESNHHIGHKWFPVSYTSIVIHNKSENKLKKGNVIYIPTKKTQCIGADHDQHGQLNLELLVNCFSSSKCSQIASKIQQALSKKGINTYKNQLQSDFFPHSWLYYDSFLEANTFLECRSPEKQRSRLGSQGILLKILPIGKVVLENRTESPNMPIFVASPCLTQTQERTSSEWRVHRIASCQSLEIFDLKYYLILQAKAHTEGPYNLKWPGESVLEPIVHISLGKGWGPDYRRPDVTHCPARLELWLNLKTLRLLHQEV